MITTIREGSRWPLGLPFTCTFCGWQGSPSDMDDVQELNIAYADEDTTIVQSQPMRCASILCGCCAAMINRVDPPIDFDGDERFTDHAMDYESATGRRAMVMESDNCIIFTTGPAADRFPSHDEIRAWRQDEQPLMHGSNVGVWRYDDGSIVISDRYRIVTVRADGSIESDTNRDSLKAEMWQEWRTSVGVAPAGSVEFHFDPNSVSTMVETADSLLAMIGQTLHVDTKTGVVRTVPIDDQG